MHALILASLLAAAPPDPASVLDRAAAAIERLGRLEAAVRALDAAELALATAQTRRERRRAWRAWLSARQRLREEAAR